MLCNVACFDIQKSVQLARRVVQSARYVTADDETGPSICNHSERHRRPPSRRSQQ